MASQIKPSGRSLLVRNSCLFLLVFLVGYYKYAGLERYPFWWWFLPNARYLCDHGEVPLSADANCFVQLRHGIVPFNIERVSVDPEILIIRKLVHNRNHLRALKRKIYTHAQPSTVYTVFFHTELERDFITAMNFRKSHIVDLRRWSSRSTEWLFSQVGLITGLNLMSSDSGGNAISGQFYDEGGHILPHHDVYPNSDDAFFGRRFATTLVYLEKAERGGHTILHNLNVRLDMDAGDAVFFYNIFPANNVPDPRLGHAGCPVLEGRKTIVTFWSKSHYQEFRKPCPVNGTVFKGFGHE